MSLFSSLVDAAVAVATIVYAPELLVAAGVPSAVAAFAATFAASMIVSRIFAPNVPNTQTNNIRQQVPPDPTAGIPLVYGSAYTSGRFIDASLTTDQSAMYYVLAISCISPNGQFSYDTSKFYYQDQLIAFGGDGVTVVSLTDQAGNVDTNINGHLYIWVYTSNQSGIIIPQNSGSMPADVMSNSNGVPSGQQWSGIRQMNGTAFAIVKLVYNANQPGTMSLQPITFHVSHFLNGTGAAKPGDVWYDYLTNTVYGGAVPSSQVDSSAATALNTYSDTLVSYTTYTGSTATQPRYRFNGVLDTGQTVLSNIDILMNCCDCWNTYQAFTGLWTVAINQVITPSFSFDDTNILSAISVGATDITQQSNQIEAKFNDSTNRDQPGYVVMELQTIDPALLYPNEPVNKYTLSLDMVNDSVTAQYLATRFLLQNRQDLVVNFSTNYTGIQVNAGDVVEVTNSAYGWTNQQFRVVQVKETVLPDGTLGATLQMNSYDPGVFTATNITQYTPASNSNLPNPNVFGTVPAPTIGTLNETSPVPFFNVTATSSSLGVVEYAEIWYSAYSSPTPSQMIFSGTTAVVSGGGTYTPGTTLPSVQITALAAGNWYFFTRMVNSVATSQFSPASAVVNWRPMTFQFANRYLHVAYGTSATGAGFNLSPRSGATYFGVYSSNSATISSIPSDYTWYLASSVFGTTNYVLFTNYGNYLVAISIGGANYAAGSGAFVPSDTSNYDPSIWLALPDGDNVIDLNTRTGQVIQTGTTTVGTGELAILNNQQGMVVASLAQLLDFGPGVYTKTSSAATITIDIYGRVVGFTAPDAFYYSMTAYTASSGQTVFSVTRASGYIPGNCFVFQNGCFLDTSNFTDASASITLTNGATAGDDITIISFRSVNSSTSAVYNSFSRNTATLSNQGTYTASGFTLVSGNELLFLNGTVVNAQDYNISGQTISFVSAATGDLQIIQWTDNNLGVPNGNPVNTDVYTTSGQSLYSFSYDPNAFNLYANGVLLLETSDYTVTTGSYTLANTPMNNTTILVQQTFSRTGAA
jgi:hypothetical protein